MVSGFWFRKIEGHLRQPIYNRLAVLLILLNPDCPPAIFRSRNQCCPTPRERVDYCLAFLGKALNQFGHQTERLLTGVQSIRFRAVAENVAAFCR